MDTYVNVGGYCTDGGIGNYKCILQAYLTEIVVYKFVTYKQFKHSMTMTRYFVLLFSIIQPIQKSYAENFHNPKITLNQVFKADILLYLATIQTES